MCICNRLLIILPGSFRRKANYFLCLVIGAWFEGAGFVLRVLMRDNLHSLNLYIVANMFIILAVSLFACV